MERQHLEHSAGTARRTCHRDGCGAERRLDRRWPERIVRWNGSAWQAIGTGPGGLSFAIEAQANGEILVAGEKPRLGASHCTIAATAARSPCSASRLAVTASVRTSRFVGVDVGLRGDAGERHPLPAAHALRRVAHAGRFHRDAADRGRGGASSPASRLGRARCHNQRGRAGRPRSRGPRLRTNPCRSACCRRSRCR